LDAAPLATVFFLLVLFMMLASRVYTPGVSLELPMSGDLPGSDRPTVSVAIDSQGRFYFENVVISDSELTAQLRKAALESKQPITLVMQADKRVTMEMEVKLTMLAREAGITNALLATLPRAGGVPSTPK
jgi:biopolymer transport protein ExbD